MTRRLIWLLALGLGLLVTEVPGADEAMRGGIIKGTITVAGKPAADVAVSVEGVSQGKLETRNSKLKPAKAVMDQKDMKFIPSVLPVLVGTTVDFPNHDNSWHNVYSKGGANDFDLGVYPPEKTRSSTFDTPGVARILCNAHPTMEAFIVVKEHPYFSGADKRGNCPVGGVPPGKYRVQVLPPELGTTEANVQLFREREVLDVSFDLKKR